ncbi:electron transfer flavoprotein subunit alpha/FixB family protein [Natronococcus jeotgali]|uniref:Electron transfer flavor protein alpha subunit-like protein n=1 Tax=Natronococcus jeotgali DSM 18795 TaxID=1227498 RepID=L9WU86_9EURY|nr:electron transfer flavoprotein subunit alpha/FixB family protein [Natronococcus jeotgali]ELY53024.1 electron transfer flavor protein alpha subunit-like protein [Natronococcus jeotgali DSM 18795]
MILALVEHDEGTPEELSLEGVAMARELATAEGDSLEVVAVGDEADALGEALGEHGVEAVHCVAHDRLEGETYAPDAWAESVAQLADDCGATAITGPGTDRGRDVLARVGTKLDAPLATDCLGVEVADDGAYELRRNRWGGSLIEHARLEGNRKLLTAAEHEFSSEPAASAVEATVSAFEPDLEDDDLAVRVDRVEAGDEEGISLGEARVVVGGGRGVGSAADYDQLEELAELLGGTVGASRAAVNEGWRPHDDQVGQTGAKISPDIYIACGISGAVQHMVGCKGADSLLAINTDPEAAIIQKADWAVIGDLHEVVPALNDALREAD